VVAVVAEKIQEALDAVKQVDLEVEHTRDQHLDLVELVEQVMILQFQHL
tara:strand:+ start:148 stop:294 length:147 start_codon:yes stop_codon:yes gene_type:complete